METEGKGKKYPGIGNFRKGDNTFYHGS